MATNSSGDNGLNFSDIDSDDDSPTQKPVIAHKDMSAFMNEKENEEKSVDQHDGSNDINKQENNFEAISPISEDGSDEKKNEFEAISPNEAVDNSKFENLFDKELSDEDGLAVSPSNDNNVETKEITTNDTGNKIGDISPTELNDRDEIKDDQNRLLESQGGRNGNAAKKVADFEDIEAPLPSPFSDIGDAEELGTGTDNELISDIMKNSSSEFSVMNQDGEKGKVMPAEEKQVSTGSPTKSTEEKTELEGIESPADESIEQSNDSVKPANVHDSSEPSTSTSTQGTFAETKQSGGTSAEDGNEGKPATENEDDEEGPGEENLIADIFGDSDEEEEFEGFDDADIGDDKEEEQTSQEVRTSREKQDDSSDDEMPEGQQMFESDFDKMMDEKKKQKAKRRRRRDEDDVVNDNDDLIADLIKRMKDCAEEDKMLNQCGKAATKKLKMLKTVVTQLRKADLQIAFIDSGILSAMKEWLTPLPDHSLPHINIRKLFLKILLEFPSINRSGLKSSGIGRAVMLLFKHPKEMGENRKMAGKLINTWARPIFNVSTNFQDMSREDREQRDKMNLPESKRRRLSSGAESSRNRLNEEEESRPRKPGDKGWIGRARVPVPSHRDYVNRPESKVSYDVSKSAKRELNRYEKTARKRKDKRTPHVNKKAVGVSLNGSKLSL